jgi:hypothetical protein
LCHEFKRIYNASPRSFAPRKALNQPRVTRAARVVVRRKTVVPRPMTNGLTPIRPQPGL